MRRHALLPLVAVAVAAGIAGLWALGTVVQPAPTYQGDQLGMESGETPEVYEARAEASISGDAGETGPVWALVTFSGALSPAEAAAVLEPADRVSAVVFPDAAARPIPEPVAGEGRADVIVREAGRLHAATGKRNAEPVGAVVRDEPAVLREIAARGDVFAVEALPDDARWGSFGISPVTPVRPGR
ncbi:hypothetical protein G7Y29_07195 [Corynebacterium qintianiae]|uniref:Uncharacterized protein n=1 Tax=Corynebacterium qintianiae TaxID=2709392 RepID=A0A7T0PFB3_9CORY|nr:hypothetical protein [Corynebacterium qintianiae]QPK82667.1 hypothetical protein G7Y29_07195 [Corynebacterium qintianiae]